MSFNNADNNADVLEVTVTPQDYNFDGKDQHMRSVSNSTPQQTIGVTPVSHIDSNHIVINEFSINPSNSYLTPPPYIHLEVYSKTSEGSTMSYPFIMSKTASIGIGNYWADHKFISAMLQSAYKDTERLFPYKLFRKNGIDLDFLNPEISYYYLNGRTPQLYRYPHPATPDILENAPAPALYNQDRQPHVRLAVHVEMKTVRTDYFAAFEEDDVNLLAPIIESIGKAKTAWTNSKSRSTSPSRRHTRNTPYHHDRQQDRNQDLRQQMQQRREFTHQASPPARRRY